MYVACTIAAALMSIAAAQASVEISSAATKNMSCDASVCSPTAKQAVLNSNDLANMLANSDVKVTTGNGAVTIAVMSPFSWTSTNRLTLDANLNISFHASVEVAGQGAVTITTNDGGTGGDLIFLPGASLDFWDSNSSLIVNAVTYGLVSDINTLAGDIEANPAGQYALAKNYDASHDHAYKKDPVQTTFIGRFEGLGHQIANLTIKNYNQSASIGFFQRLASPAVVRDFGLQYLKIVTGNEPYYIGAIAGYIDGGSLIGCWSDGSIEVYGTPNVGGLVGNNYGAISRSNASVNIQFKSADNSGYAGGLAGINYGPIDHSAAMGLIAGNGFNGQAGGLVGWDDGQISYSHASVDINVADVAIGGLVGEAHGSIESSYATGAINQPATTSENCVLSVGGLVGTSVRAAISNSYATSSVTAGEGNCVGGLVGLYGDVQHQVTISSAYATGALSGSGAAIGGFVGSGHLGLSIINAYWDIDTTGTEYGESTDKHPNGVTGLTDAQIKSGLPDGFDPAIWRQKKNINNGYPYLIANPPPQ
jgi:hypothetical protein